MGSGGTQCPHFVEGVQRKRGGCHSSAAALKSREEEIPSLARPSCLPLRSCLLSLAAGRAPWVNPLAWWCRRRGWWWSSVKHDGAAEGPAVRN